MQNKKFIILSLSTLIALSSILLPSWAHAEDDMAEAKTEETTYSIEDFENNRDYFIKKCSTKESMENSDTVEDCKAFKQYLSDRNDSLKQEADNLQANIDDISQNIEEYTPLVKEYNMQIEAIENDILSLNAAMEEANMPVQELTNKIIKLDEEIKFIENSQLLRSKTVLKLFDNNKLIDFVFDNEEAGKIEEIIRNESQKTQTGVNEQKEIDDRLNEIENIDSQRNGMSDEISEYSLLRDELSEASLRVKELKEGINKIIYEHKKQQEALESEMDTYIQNYDEVKDIIQNISENLSSVVSVDKFIIPVSGYTISAQAWNYPASFGGGYHLGLDFAVRVGTEVKAPGNGLILYSASACPDYGELGSSCGAPGIASGGNQLFMLTVLKDEVYLLTMYHLQSGSVLAPNTVVKQGDVIARTASSGNSTGPHLHLEVVKLNGYDSIEEVVKNFNGDLSFGTYFGGKAGYDMRCKGNDTKPCKVNPSDLFGVHVGDQG